MAEISILLLFMKTIKVSVYFGIHYQIVEGYFMDIYPFFPVMFTEGKISKHNF